METRSIQNRVVHVGVRFFFCLLAGGGCPSCGDFASDAGNPESARAVRQATSPPETITTLAQLRAMHAGGTYLLGANITMSSSDAAFVPIGDANNPFVGSFDGAGFKIINLRINSEVAGHYAGLFGYVQYSTLYNIRLENVSITGTTATTSIGAIAGRMDSSSLTGSYVAGGTVTGKNSVAAVGMAVGRVGKYVSFTRSYATGTVNGKAAYIGGFLGRGEATGLQFDLDDPRTQLLEIFTNVNVSPTIPSSGNVYAGGLVGYIKGGNIWDISVVGAVSGRNGVGGMIGFAVNNDPNTQSTVLKETLFRNNVTDYGSATDRAGLVGNALGGLLGFSNRCDWGYWDTGTDSGTPWTGVCPQPGVADSVLRAPHPSPDRLLSPFHNSLLITQDMVPDPYPPCKVGSGSDGDWGFNTCAGDPVWQGDDQWLLNSSTEHITLKYIPNPSVQPK